MFYVYVCCNGHATFRLVASRQLIAVKEVKLLNVVCIDRSSADCFLFRRQSLCETWKSFFNRSVLSTNTSANQACFFLLRTELAFFKFWYTSSLRNRWSGTSCLRGRRSGARPKASQNRNTFCWCESARFDLFVSQFHCICYYYCHVVLLSFRTNATSVPFSMRFRVFRHVFLVFHQKNISDICNSGQLFSCSVYWQFGSC